MSNLSSKSLFVFGLIALTAACTPQGKPVADGMKLPDQPSHKSAINYQELSEAKNAEQEHQGPIDNLKELIQPLRGIGVNLESSTLEITIGQMESGNTIGSQSIKADGVGSDKSEKLDGECRLVKKSERTYLVVSQNVISSVTERNPNDGKMLAERSVERTSRSLQFELPLDIPAEVDSKDGNTIFTNASLISYVGTKESGAEISLLDPKTLNAGSESIVNIKDVGSSKLEMTGEGNLKAINTDETTSVQVKSNFSCTIDSSQVLEIGQKISE
jgi:hypothetical protein